MSKAEDFLSPIMRLVQGDCFTPQEKDQNGAPLTVKRGPNAGQPTKKFFIAIAGKKNDPAVEALRAQFDRKARADFPHLYPVPGGPCSHPKFAMKIVDGDGVDDNGKPNSSKEGFAGHWIFRFSSQYAPKCYANPNYRPDQQLTDTKSIPRGHFVKVAGTINGNGDANKPGLFANCSMISWEHVGGVITSGPDAQQVFGAGATPAAGGPVMLPAAGATTYQQYRDAGWSDAQLIDAKYMAAPVAVVAPPPAAVAPPPSAAVAPPPSVVAPPPSVAVVPHATILTGPVMLPAAGATTYQQYRDAGWSDAQLIDAKYMAAPAAPAPLPPAGSVQPPPSVVQAAPVGKVMLPAAGTTTYQQYIDAGWSDAQLVQNFFMAP